MAKVPELKTGQMITLAYFIGILVILFVIYKILGKLGIIKTAEKKEAEKNETEAVNELRTNDLFDPQYWKGKYYRVIGKDNANILAGRLRVAMQGLGTDEEMILTTFGKLKCKINVSEVTYAYAQLYKRDLRLDMIDELSDSEMNEVWQIIKKLPNA